MTRPDEQKDFEDLEASQLFGSTCKRAMPVRKRLFLVLLIKKFSTTSAPSVALWWGKRSNRGGDRLNGRESKGQPRARQKS
jgi:hypothetical protein